MLKLLASEEGVVLIPGGNLGIKDPVELHKGEVAWIVVGEGIVPPNYIGELEYCS